MPRVMAESASNGEVVAGAAAVGVDCDDGPVLGLYRPGATWPATAWEFEGRGRFKVICWTAAEWATTPEARRPAAAQPHPNGCYTLLVLAARSEPT